MKEECINRLIRCGVNPSEACRTYNSFLMEYHSTKQLDEYLADLEKDYVEEIQS